MTYTVVPFEIFLGFQFGYVYFYILLELLNLLTLEFPTYSLLYVSLHSQTILSYLKKRGKAMTAPFLSYISKSWV